MYLKIFLSGQLLANGGYTPAFVISEYYGEKTRVTPFSCSEIASSEKEAIDIARGRALQNLKENYPADIKVKFEENR